MALVRTSIMFCIVFTIITGIVYPLSVTGVGQLLFPYRANGSIIVKDGKAVGSSLIGQQFDDPGVFWSRPSATSPYPYNASSSSGSNMGQANPDLTSAIQDRVAHLKAADPLNTLPVPIDLVTASAIGLDPHISPAAAMYQTSRVAKSRALGEEVVRSLVTTHTQWRQLGLFGEPVVNVLELNLALMEIKRK